MFDSMQKFALLLLLIASSALAADVPFSNASVPSLASDGDGGFVASFIDGKSLKIARYRSGKWSEAKTVVTADNLMVNKYDTPVIAARGNTIVASWITKNAPHGSAVYVARSADGGATWTKGQSPHPAMASEFGFPAVALASDGSADLIWLDGRGLEGGMEGHGDMQLHHAKLTKGGQLTDEERVDARVCDCCGLSLAQTGDALIAVYRDRSGEEVRDIAAMRRGVKGWSDAQRVAADGWTIKGCPVNGPQVDARGNDVAVAWFTAAEKPAVKVAFSRDGGATFAAPVVLDDTKPAGRVDVALTSKGDALVSWVDGDDAVVQRVTRDGASGEPRRLGKATGFPRLAVSKENAAVIWSAADGVHFETLP